MASVFIALFSMHYNTMWFGHCSLETFYLFCVMHLPAHSQLAYSNKYIKVDERGIAQWLLTKRLSVRYDLKKTASEDDFLI